MTNLTKLILLIPLLLNGNAVIMTSGQQISPIRSIQDLQMANTAIEFIAETGESQTGGGMFGIGDIDDDGYDDFFIGATGGQGKAYLIYGRENWANISLAEIPNSIIGEQDGDTFGGWFAALGDINNDSVTDYAIAALRHAGGKIYIYSKEALLNIGQNELASTSSWASFIGEGSGDFLGHGLSGIGDINQDGYDDILVSGEFNDEVAPDAGKVYLIYGRSTAEWSNNTSIRDLANVTFLGDTDLGFFAMDVTAIPDINGDNIPDFATSSRSGTNRISIFFGGTNWPSQVEKSIANVTINLDRHDPNNIGKHIDGLGDINGDGYNDLIYGAWGDLDTTLPENYQKGKVYVFLGRPTAEWPSTMEKGDANATLIAGRAPSPTGYAAGSMKDMNGDGYDEILIGNPGGQDEVEQTAFILQGRPSDQWHSNMNLTTESYMIIRSGVTNNQGFANQFKSMGDVDGDGLPEITINRWKYNVKGGVYLIHDLSVPAVPTSTGDPTSDEDKGSLTFISFATSFVVIWGLRRRKSKKVFIQHLGL